jgi:4'-phosphopantetheinyl transferase
MSLRFCNLIPIALSRKDAEYRAVMAWTLNRDYESLAEICPAFLHPDELSYFRSLEFDRRRRSYLLGRHAAKQAIMAYSHRDTPTQLEVAAGIFQQPVVRPGCEEPTGVSITHSDRVACAIAYSELHPMAIDVEEIDPARNDVMKTRILPGELTLASAAWGSSLNHCATIWTAKEALSKILRCGMMCPYELLAVKDLTARDTIFCGCFENFAQYKFQTWIAGQTAMTIVLPRNSTMTVDMTEFIQQVRQLEPPPKEA